MSYTLLKGLVQGLFIDLNTSRLIKINITKICGVMLGMQLLHGKITCFFFIFTTTKKTFSKICSSLSCKRLLCFCYLYI